MYNVVNLKILAIYHGVFHLASPNKTEFPPPKILETIIVISYT